MSSVVVEYWFARKPLFRAYCEPPSHVREKSLRASKCKNFRKEIQMKNLHSLSQLSELITKKRWYEIVISRTAIGAERGETRVN